MVTLKPDGPSKLSDLLFSELSFTLITVLFELELSSLSFCYFFIAFVLVVVHDFFLLRTFVFNVFLDSHGRYDSSLSSPKVDSVDVSYNFFDMSTQAGANSK